MSALSDVTNAKFVLVSSPVADELTASATGGWCAPSEVIYDYSVGPTVSAAASHADHAHDAVYGFCLLTAAKKWTAADEAKIKRDSEGKFAKKAGTKLNVKLYDPSIVKFGSKAALKKWIDELSQKDYDAFTSEQRTQLADKIAALHDPDLTASYAALLTGVKGKNLTPTLPGKTAAAPVVTAGPSKPLHINTKVIYTNKYADQAVVAEKTMPSGVKFRLIWDADSKKFIQQGYNKVVGDWVHTESYTKKDAYAKFSKESGWFTSSAPSLKPLAAQQVTKPAVDDDSDFEVVNETAKPPPPPPITVKVMTEVGEPVHINTVAVYKTKYADGAVIAVKQGPGTPDDPPQRLIWDAKKKKFTLQTQEDDGSWVDGFSYNKGETYQKFSKQTGWTKPVAAPSVPAAPAIDPSLKVSQVDTFDSFQKLTTGKKAAWLVSLTPKDLEKFDPSEVDSLKAWVDELHTAGHLSDAEKPVVLGDLAQWGSSGSSIQVPDLDSMNSTKALSWILGLTHNDWQNLNPLQKALIEDKINEVDANDDLSQSQLEKYNKIKTGTVGSTPASQTDPDVDAFLVGNISPATADLAKNLTLQKLSGYSDNELDQVKSKLGQLLSKGHLEYSEAIYLSDLADKAGQPSIVEVPDFENATPTEVSNWFENLTEDQFKDLSTSDQLMLKDEAKFYDVFAPGTSKYSDKIAGFLTSMVSVGGTPDAKTDAQQLDFDTEMADHLMAPLVFSDWFDVHTANVDADVWHALAPKTQAKLTLLADGAAMFGVTGPKEKIDEWELDATAVPSGQKVTFDWDNNSGPEGMSPAFYEGSLVAYLKAYPDGSGGTVVTVNPDGSEGVPVGEVDFDEGETVSNSIIDLVDIGMLSPVTLASPPASAPVTKVPTPIPTPSVVTTPTAPGLDPNASVFHVDVHGKIKKISQISTPASPAPPPSKYKVVSPSQASATQQTMLSAAGKTWTKAETDAIKRYGTSVGYQTTNAVLRDDKKRLAMFNDAQLKAGVKNAVDLQKAMTPLTDDLKLFRGTGAHMFGQDSIAADFTKLKALEGKTLTDKGFMSTTVDEKKAVTYDYAKKPLQVVINAPAGTPAVYADSAIPGHSEHEIILAAGTSYRIDEVRAATAADKALYGNHVQHVVVTTIVPSDSNISVPLKNTGGALPKVVPNAVAPSGLSPASPSTPVAPTLGPLTWTDLKQPMKITTKVIHTTKYANGAVVAYKKNTDKTLSRLVWNDNTKKFILQNQQSDGSWENFTGHSKKEAYALFGKQTTWYAPPPGDSALGAGSAPKISTTAPVPTSAPSVPAAPPKPQPKMDAATLQALYGDLPPFGATIKRELFDNFKKKSSQGTIMLSSLPEQIFTALNETLIKHNAEPNKAVGINLLQLLRIIDEESTNKANFLDKQSGGEGKKTNTKAYEKKIVDWLQTPAGATYATDLLHPTPAGPVVFDPDVINPITKTYKSKFSQETINALAKIKPVASIGVPKSGQTSFNVLNVTQAKKMQNEMLASEPWTTAQSKALTKYTTQYYTTLNPVVRDLVSTTQYQSESEQLTAARTAVNIQAGMRPITQNVQVYRRTGLSQLPGLTNSASFADAKKFEGKLFVDRAPLSTSVTEGTWSGNLHMTIDLPEGTPAAFVKSISANPSEDEMLLALGTKYRVLSVTKGYGSIIKMHIRVEA